MRVAWLTPVVIALLVNSCHMLDAGVPPNEAGADRVYVVRWCNPHNRPPGPPPCEVNYRAAGTDFVDSARVTLTRDRVATWMLAKHSHSCPCYLGGCTTPCHDTPSTIVDTATGTYEFWTEGVTLHLPERLVQGFRTGAMTFAARIPAKVEGGWMGPDSLMLDLCITSDEPHCIVFRPQ
jgi:hypothetical protein